jgi:hypothetical protein
MPSHPPRTLQPPSTVILMSSTLLNSYEHLELRDSWLTSRSWALLEKPPIVQPRMDFPASYGTRRFIAVSTRALHWSLSWATSTQSILPHSIPLRSNIERVLYFPYCTIWTHSLLPTAEVQTEFQVIHFGLYSDIEEEFSSSFCVVPCHLLVSFHQCYELICRYVLGQCGQYLGTKSYSACTSEKDSP